MPPSPMEGVGSPDGRAQLRPLASETLPISGLPPGGERPWPTHPCLSLEAWAGDSVNCH